MYGSVKNFLMHVTVNYEDGEQDTTPSFEVLFRRNNWNSCYCLAGHAPDTLVQTNLHLFTRVNNNWQPTIEGAAKVWTPKTPFNLVVRCQGSSIKAWANDKLALDVTDNNVTDSGSITLGVGAVATVSYSNLIISDLD
jgi:hypothetical protein